MAKTNPLTGSLNIDNNMNQVNIQNAIGEDKKYMRDEDDWAEPHRARFSWMSPIQAVTSDLLKSLQTVTQNLSRWRVNWKR